MTILSRKQLSKALDRKKRENFLYDHHITEFYSVFLTNYQIQKNNLRIKTRQVNRFKKKEKRRRRRKRRGREAKQQDTEMYLKHNIVKAKQLGGGLKNVLYTIKILKYHTSLIYILEIVV